MPSIKIHTDIKAQDYHPEEFVSLTTEGRKEYWEVKVPFTYSPEGNRIIKIEMFSKALISSAKLNSNIIVNIQYLEQSDLDILYEIMKTELNRSQLLQIIMVHPDASKTKAKEQLASFLGK